MKRRKVVAIIQARMGSKRLPGKVLSHLSGKPLLEHLINRLRVSKEIDQIVVATSTSDIDKPIIELAKKLDVECYKGSEDDVLNRYYEAGKLFKADVVVRVTADNPLTDPYQLDELIKKHMETDSDYTHNKHQKGPPLGTAAEVISFPILKKIHTIAKAPRHREHVTLYIFEHADQFNIQTVDAPLKFQRMDLRLTVDTEKDLILMREIFDNFDFGSKYIPLEEVIDFLDENRDLIELNKDTRQKGVNFKILQLLDAMDIKGESILILQLARKLMINGHDVIVVSNGGSLLSELDKSQIRHIELEKYDNTQNNFFKHIFEVTKIIDREKPDIIHAHNDYFAFISAIAARVSNVRPKPNVIWSIHTIRSGMEHYVCDKYISTYFEALTAVSENIKEEIVKHGIKKEQIIVLPNAIEIEEKLLSKEFRQEFLKKYNLDNGVKIIGTVSRLDPLKGIQYLIKGFKRVKEELGDVFLVVCGSGDYKKELELIVHEMGLSENIIFTGFIRDRLNVINLFDIFVLPSSKEGLPISVLEALSIGVPVIATKVGGVPELIKNDDTGILISPYSEDEVSSALFKILKNPELREKIARNGKKFVQEKFNFTNIYKKIEKLYTELVWNSKNTN